MLTLVPNATGLVVTATLGDDLHSCLVKLEGLDLNEGDKPLMDNLDAWVTSKANKGIILEDGYKSKVFDKVKGGKPNKGEEVKKEEAGNQVAGREEPRGGKAHGGGAPIGGPPLGGIKPPHGGGIIGDPLIV